MVTGVESVPSIISWLMEVNYSPVELQAQQNKLRCCESKLYKPHWQTPHLVHRRMKTAEQQLSASDVWGQ